MICQAHVVGCWTMSSAYASEVTCKYTGAAVVVNIPGNGQENPISYWCLSIKDTQMFLVGKIQSPTVFQDNSDTADWVMCWELVTVRNKSPKFPYPGPWGHVQCTNKFVVSGREGKLSRQVELISFQKNCSFCLEIKQLPYGAVFSYSTNIFSSARGSLGNWFSVAM